jgi:hypothetical protein
MPVFKIHEFCEHLAAVAFAQISGSVEIDLYTLIHEAFG